MGPVGLSHRGRAHGQHPGSRLPQRLPRLGQLHHLGHEVPDYFFEFYRDPTNNSSKNQKFEADFYKNVVNDVHVYAPNKSWRALYLNIKALQSMQAQIPQLYISVCASPVYNERKQPVTYRKTLLCNIPKFF